MKKSTVEGESWWTL